MSEGKVIELVKGVIGEFASMSYIDEDNDKIHCYVEKEASEAVFTDNIFEIIMIILTVSTIPNKDEENEEDGETGETDKVRVIIAVEDNRDTGDPGGHQSTSTGND